MRVKETFLQLCEAFAAKENALYTQTAWDKHMTFFSVYFRASRVELVYSRKWETMAPPSVLFARIYLSKNNPVYLHLPELIGFLGIDDYRACYFPYIENPQRMTDCMEALTEILSDYIPKIEELANTGEDQAILERWANEGFFASEGSCFDAGELIVDGDPGICIGGPRFR